MPIFNRPADTGARIVRKLLQVYAPRLSYCKRICSPHAKISDCGVGTKHSISGRSISSRLQQTDWKLRVGTRFGATNRKLEYQTNSISRSYTVLRDRPSSVRVWGNNDISHAT